MDGHGRRQDWSLPFQLCQTTGLGLRGETSLKTYEDGPELQVSLKFLHNKGNVCDYLNFVSVSSLWDQQGRRAAWERNQVIFQLLSVLFADDTDLILSNTNL